MTDHQPGHTKQKRTTRAKSCTACRQAKSKCDLRTKYPSPCTRCEKSQLSCRTSASFQRVATRTRIKALEAQVEELNRSRSLDVPSGPPATGGSSEQFSGSMPDNPSDTTDATCDDEPASDWYVPSNQLGPPSFVLYDLKLSWDDVNELFLYFTEHHLPHCGFLIRISSLAELAQDSELLLWTIILVAARHHRKYYLQNRALEKAHSRLRADKCSEAIRKLPDLQAVLLLCMFPLPVTNQDGDTAGLRLAEALSCARQMGLDMSENEILFSTHRAADQLQKYPTRSLRLTWLKCFELDVQLSLWHGIPPALAASRYLRSVARSCRSPDVPRSVAQSMDIYVRTSRYLLLLDDSPSPESAWSQAQTFLQEIALAQESNASGWSLDNELVANTCRMYICMTSYVHIARQQQALPENDRVDSSAAYAKQLLRDAQEQAINATQRLGELSDKAMSKDQSRHAGTNSLPGQPKNTSRLMFFACCILLKYMDSERDEISLVTEKASAAFRGALRFFHRCPKATSYVATGNTLDSVGRAIAGRQARLDSHFTSRMGASVIHDVRWLSRSIRARTTENEPAAQDSHGSVPVPINGSTDASDCLTGSKDLSLPSDGTDQSQWTEWCYPGTEALPSSMDLPAFEMWDDMLDGVWQNDFMGQNLSQWDPYSR